MKYVVYHAISPLGYPVDIWTNGEEDKVTYEKLFEDEAMRLMTIEKTGAKVLKDVPPVVQSTLQVTTTPQEYHCVTCDNLMFYKEGISVKNNKPWKGYFCSEKGHMPKWIK